MHDIQSFIETTRFSLDQFLQLIDDQLEHLIVDKRTKLEELKPLLADEETPPNVLIAAQLAALRPSHNLDQLSKVRYFLQISQELLQGVDDLPYVWNKR